MKPQESEEVLLGPPTEDGKEVIDGRPAVKTAVELASRFNTTAYTWHTGIVAFENMAEMAANMWRCADGYTFVPVQSVMGKFVDENTMSNQGFPPVEVFDLKEQGSWFRVPTVLSDQLLWMYLTSMLPTLKNAAKISESE